jgi:error-prone DNA polymerase
MLNLWVFYAPATIVEDTKRHRVIVRCIDVNTSGWDCTLEPSAESRGGFALRMGLRYVKGLSESDGEKVMQARRSSHFLSLEDFVRRTWLDAGSLSSLAEAGAFESFNIDRRSALWGNRRLIETAKDSLMLRNSEAEQEFEPLSAFEEVGWDYRTTSHSPRRHPLEPLRLALSAHIFR